MQEDSIPPSPNWYLSSILSCSADGAVAYVSKNQVAIVQRGSRQVTIIPSAHYEKVVALSFGRGPNANLLATVGSDQWVRVWDVTTKLPHLGHTEHGENAKVVCVDWSRADPQMVVSVDDSGALILLDIASRTTQTFQIHRLRASTIACCPHVSDLVAIGDTSGLVYIVSTKGGRVLHRMRGHDTAVVSLSWCPSPFNVLSSDRSEERDLLLASGAKASGVFVWRTGSDGRQQAVLELPHVPMAGKKTPNKQHKTALSAPPGTANPGWWVATCWPRPHVLLTSSLWGETLAWDMSESADHTLHRPGWKKDSPHCHLFNTVHSRGLFSIACSNPGLSNVPYKSAALNWRKPNISSLQQPEYRPKFKRKTKTGFLEEPLQGAENGAHEEDVAVEETMVEDGSSRNLKDGEMSEDTVVPTEENKMEEITVLGTTENTRKVDVVVPTEDTKMVENTEVRTEKSKTEVIAPTVVPTEAGESNKGAVPPFTNGIANSSSVKEDSSNQLMEDDNTLIWTCGQDRLLCATPLCTTPNNPANKELCLPTVGGNVYCMTASPLDSHRLAFGAGDGMIRVWTISPGEEFKILNLWNKISGKVAALAWHPTKETLLAYGTSDGRVGVYDTAVHNKGPAYLWNQHKTCVYTLGWGPPTYKEELVESSSPSHQRLYSCGDGAILQYTLGANNRPVKLTDVVDWALKTQITDFVWKQDFSLVAFGCDDGSVLLCRPPHLPVMCRLQAHKKMVQSLAWHPLTTALHPTGCPERHWIAVSSKSMDIKVFDCAPLFKGVNLVEAEACVATLTGHRERVTRVDWSPYISGRLLSCSYDNTARVWDVHTRKQLAVYSAHTAWIYCCLWSPFDTNLAITGSGDFTLRVWSVSDHPPSSHSGKGRNVNVKNQFPLATRLVDSAKPPVKVAVADDEKASAAAKVDKEKMRKCSYFPISSQMRNRGKDFCVQSCYALLRAKDQQQQESGLDSALQSLQIAPPSLILPEAKKMNGIAPEPGPAGDPGVTPTPEAKVELIGEGDLTHLGFFTDREAVERLVKQEEELLIANKHRQLSDQLRLWRSNNYAEVLEAAKAEKRLTNWHLAIAPMVSPRVWRDTCVAYATQLAERDRIPEAVDMLIAVRRPREAIDLLLSSNLFREAIVVARCQMFDEGEAAREVTRKWALYAESVGNYELALDCYVSLGEYQQAARLQGCRQDSASLQLAALLASRGEASSLEFTLAQQCLQVSLAEENWMRIAEVLQTHKQLESWTWVVEYYRELLDSFRLSAAAFSNQVWEWLEVAASQDASTATPPRRVADKCVGVDLVGAGLMLRTLQTTEPTSQAQLLILVSGYLTVTETKPVYEDKCLLWTAALAACHQYHLHHGGQMLLRLFVYLFPKGPHLLPTSLQAYCYAGLYAWLEANMWFHRKTETEPQSKQLSSLLSAMSSTSPAVFSADAILHFRIIGRIKELERTLVNARARTVEDAARKNKTLSSATSLDKSNTETPTEPLQNTCEDVQVPSVDPPTNKDSVKAFTIETLALQSLKKLRTLKQMFIDQRHSTPNPFVAYTETKNMFLCNSSVAGKEFLALVEELWSKADVEATHRFQEIEEEDKSATCV